MSAKRDVIWCAGLAALFCASATLAQEPTSTAFMYQGQLKQSGEPFTGTADFLVGLYDVETDGSPRDSVLVPNVAVAEGLFTIELSFDFDSIDGDGLWLDIAVAIPSGGSYTTLTPRQPIRPTPYALYALNADGSGEPFTLPYSGSCPMGSGDAFTIVQPDDGVAAIVAECEGEEARGVYASVLMPDSVAIEAQAYGEASPAVIGTANGTGTMINYGGMFTAHADWGRGVYGYAPATSGYNYGVYGQSDSVNGRGVYGRASASSGNAKGVEGESQSPDGAGVYGYNDWDAEGPAIGVRGSTNSPDGFGGWFDGKGYFSGRVGVGNQDPDFQLDVVSSGGDTAVGAANPGEGTFGYLAHELAGVYGEGHVGVMGQATSPTDFAGWFDGKGYFSDYLGVGTSDPDYTLHVIDVSGSAAVYAENPDEENFGALGSEWGGVYGEGHLAVAGNSYSATGKGVQGWASSATGINHGVYGRSESTSGRGVYGYASSTTGANYGVYAQSNSASGRGVYAEASSTSGYTIGLEAYAASPDGYAVYAYNEGESGHAIAIQGVTASPDGFGGWFDGKGYFSGYVGVGTDDPEFQVHVISNTGTAIGGISASEETAGYLGHEIAGVFGEGAYAIMGSSVDGFAGYFYGQGHFSDRVGIGTDDPAQMLDVDGTVKMVGFQLSTAPATGYVLTSDTSGVGTWQPASGGGDSPWQECATGIWLEEGNVGVGAEDPTSKLEVWTGWETSAFKAVTTRSTPEVTSIGVWGEATAVDAIGVRGHTSATTGTTSGGYFTTASEDGYGVWGHNESPSVYSYRSVGVYGSSDGTKGVGVKGYVPGPQGVAVWGRAMGTSSRAVYAESTATSGSTYGLEAYAASPDGYAVYAYNEGDSGNAIAIRGDTVSPDGFGGYFNGRGYFSGSVGIGTMPGVKLDVSGTVRSTGFRLITSPEAGYVLTSDALGTGTWQEAADPPWEESGSDIYYDVGDVGIGTTTPEYPLDILTGAFRAIRARTSANNGTAIHGEATYQGGSVPIACGVRGITAAEQGCGVEGEATNGGVGVKGIATSGGQAGYFLGDLVVSNGQLGVGTIYPDEALDVDGTAKMTGFQLTTAPTNGYVLTCNANGVGTWQEATGGGSFDLPFDGSVSSTDGSALSITNTASTGYDTIGGKFQTDSDNGKAVRAQSDGTAAIGVSSEVSGTIGIAVHAVSTGALGFGMYAQNNSTNPTLEARNYGSGDIIKGFAGSTNVFRVTNDGTTVTNVLQIEGGSDLSEQFDVQAAEGEAAPGMVVCIDPANPGKLIVSTQAYDRKVAGIVSGAGGVQPGMLMGQKGTVADGQHPVALSGRVYVWADASSGAIEPGDLLTTSDVPGHAMKVGDHGQAQGAILGKAMTSLEEGRGLVLVLVALQ